MSDRWGRAVLAMAGTATLALGACGSDTVSTSADTSASGTPLEGTTWVLAEGTDLGVPLGEVVVSQQVLLAQLAHAALLEQERGAHAVLLDQLLDRG